MTGVSECSQQRGNLKDDGYNYQKKELTNPAIFFTDLFCCPDN
ncbi:MULTISPECIES: hypothetical protein [Photorhabdus]|nr:hypothetical protein [Photorhabdus asymbiotica]